MDQAKVVEESVQKILNDKIFIGCVPQLLLGLFLNTLSNIPIKNAQDRDWKIETFSGFS